MAGIVGAGALLVHALSENRKVWGGNRTRVGADAQEVLMSVFETCRRRARPVLDFVSGNLRAWGNRLLQGPTLLPGR